MADSSDDRLNSWKGIAAYLERNERTAMRWAQQHRLPVHHIREHGSVFAYKSEIDAWLARSGVGGEKSRAWSGDKPNPTGPVQAPNILPPARDGQWRLRRLASLALTAIAVGGLVLILSAILLSWRKPGGPPVGRVTRVTFTADSVVAWDSSRRLWEHEFPYPLDAGFWGSKGSISDFVRILDLDNRKKTDVVIVVPFRPSLNPGGFTRTEVDCFSSTGSLLWSYVPQGRFQFGQYELEGPWVVTALYVSDGAAGPSVWVSAGHYIWGNSFVSQIDLATGHTAVRFVNTGDLYALSEVETQSGTYLLAGGFNNEYSAGILAVMNEKTPFATSPQTVGTRHQCVSCPPGVPDEYFVFPRTEINRVEGVYEDPVRGIDATGEQIEIHKAEAQGRAQAGTIYMFRSSPFVWPISLRYDSSYDMLDRRLEMEGKIRSSLSGSPERLHPQPVAVWTPSRGWADCDFRAPGIASAHARPITKPPEYLLAAARQ